MNVVNNTVKLGKFVISMLQLGFVQSRGCCCFPLILVTNVTPCDNRHHKHTGTHVTVKHQLWQRQQLAD